MNILKKKIGGFTMGELIAVVLALIIVHGIPYYLDQKESKRKSEEMYRNLTKQSQDEMEKWRK